MDGTKEPTNALRLLAFAMAGLAVFGAVVFAPVGLVAQQSPQSSSDVSLPAEEIRLPQPEFREGLKKRGLTDILELHVREFPPAGTTAGVLLLRDVKLAEAGDTARPLEARRAALAEANRMLEGLIERESQDSRRFLWRFALAHSLIYEEGEPYSTSILYTDGSRDDRQKLAALTERALRAIETLSADIEAEYLRMDGLSAADFETIEKSGFVDEIDRLAPRTSYLLPWALFYDASARVDMDTQRVHALSRIVELINAQPALLATQHSVSGVQLQATLLLGMTQRRLNNRAPAREFLDKAIAIAERIEDAPERARVAWATRLAWIEKIRVERDDDRFDDAATALARFRGTITSTEGASAIGLQIVAALLDRSVYLARAVAAERSGRSAGAAVFREESWKVLAQWAAVTESNRRELYATLYHLLDSDVDKLRLDPIETAAVLAGLLSDAERTAATSDASLALAVQIGRAFVERATGLQRDLVPEILYNVGVAEYRRGRVLEAADAFVRIAAEHPSYVQAAQSATLAVQILSPKMGDPVRQKSEPTPLYVKALETLVQQFPTTGSAKYYRFFFANALADTGENDRAAAQFVLVSPEHEHYVESVFLRLRCMAESLSRLASVRGNDALEIGRRINEIQNLQREFVLLATERISRQRAAAEQVLPRELLAGSKIILAEVLVLPGVNRPSQALETLDAWESLSVNDPGLLGRVWRVRIISYERLGRLDEAARAIPSYLAADPDGAGPTLQTLFTALRADAESLRAAQDDTGATRKAETALLVANQVDEWVRTRGDRLSPSDRKALTLQLAEANLHAGRLDEAKILFLGLVGTATSPDPAANEASSDPRAILGYAETLYRLKDWQNALPLFNRLAMKLPPADPIRWEALLRDLQCRTELNQPPAGIIKVIQQQKYLYPDLGGPATSGQFQQLLRENERRATG